MRKSALLLILFLSAAPLIAAPVASDEDRTRFVERLYDKTEPGLRSREEYIALAKKFIKRKDPNVPFVDFADPVVTYRTYRNAPKADRKMICVNFAYLTSTTSHGTLGGNGGTFLMQDTQKSVLLVLMRPDLSKVYINVVHLKPT